MYDCAYVIIIIFFILDDLFVVCAKRSVSVSPGRDIPPSLVHPILPPSPPLCFAGRPPRKRIEVEEGMTTTARQPAPTPRPTPSTAQVARPQAPVAVKAEAPHVEDRDRDRFPPPARVNTNGNANGTGNGIGNGSGNGIRNGRVRSDSAGDEAYPVFRSRRERDRYGGYPQEEDAGSSEDDVGEEGEGSRVAEEEEEEEGIGGGQVEEEEVEEREEDMRRAGGGGGRRARYGRRYSGVGSGVYKRPSRSSSSAGSEESFADAQASGGWAPLTPPDRRLRAAGSSPMGYVLLQTCATVILHATEIPSRLYPKRECSSTGVKAHCFACYVRILRGAQGAVCCMFFACCVTLAVRCLGARWRRRRRRGA